VTPAEPARAYAYLSDTIYLPENAKLVKGVDLLFHESTFLDKDKTRAKQTFHTTAKQAAEFAKMAGVGRLMLGHYSSRYDDDNLFLEEAKEIFPNTILANEGLVVEV
jgi:ribonuclease Z